MIGLGDTVKVDMGLFLRAAISSDLRDACPYGTVLRLPRAAGAFYRIRIPSLPNVSDNGSVDAGWLLYHDEIEEVAQL